MIALSFFVLMLVGVVVAASVSDHRELRAQRQAMQTGAHHTNR